MFHLPSPARVRTSRTRDRVRGSLERDPQASPYGLTTAEVSRKLGISLRQLQLWDEYGIVRASRVGSVRRWPPSEVRLVWVILDLRSKELPLQKIRKLLREIRQVVETFETGFLWCNGFQVQMARDPLQVCKMAACEPRAVYVVNLDYQNL